MPPSTDIFSLPSMNEGSDRIGYRIIGDNIHPKGKEQLSLSAHRRHTCLLLSTIILSITITILVIFIGLRFSWDLFPIAQRSIDKNATNDLSRDDELTKLLNLVKTLSETKITKEKIPETILLMPSSIEVAHEWTHVCLPNFRIVDYNQNMIDNIFNSSFQWMKPHYDSLEDYNKKKLFPYLYVYLNGGFFVQRDSFCTGQELKLLLASSNTILIQNLNGRISENIFASSPRNSFLMRIIYVLIINPWEENPIELVRNYIDFNSTSIIERANFQLKCQDFNECRRLGHLNSFTFVKSLVSN